jgi:RNA polymerase sigma factor (sigma-70 family)
MAIFGSNQTGGSLGRDLKTIFDAGTFTGLSDGQLLDRFGEGRNEYAEAAFTALVERHGPMVLRVCNRLLHDPHDSADAFQAVFLVLVRRAASLRRSGSLASWLYGVALRVATKARSQATRRRARERLAAVSADAASQAEVMTSDLELEVSWPELHEEIARLPEKFREPIVLCYLEGQSTEAAAEALGCARGTILSRLSRARQRLRTRLLKRGVAIPATLLSAEVISPSAPAAVPAALLAATVRAALGFSNRSAAATALVSTSAGVLAREVLNAMTWSKLKTVIGASLICLFTVGGIPVIARQLRGTGVSPSDEAESTQQRKSTQNEPVPAKPAIITKGQQPATIETLRSELNAAIQKNYALQTELEQLRAKLSSFAIQPELPVAKPSLPAEPPVMEKAFSKQAIPPGFSAGEIQTSDTESGKLHYTRSGNLVFVSSSIGDRFAICDLANGRSASIRLPASKDSPLTITPISDAENRFLVLGLQGPRITRIAAFHFQLWKWIPLDLREPVSGTMSPLVGSSAVVYRHKRFIYAFSPYTFTWGVLELPEGVSARPVVSSDSVTAEGGGHIYTFLVQKGTWKDIDLNALIRNSLENEPPTDASPEKGKDAPQEKPSTRPDSENRPEARATHGPGELFAVRILADRNHDGAVVERALAPDGFKRPPEGYRWHPIELKTNDNREELILRKEKAGNEDENAQADREFVLVKRDSQNLTERDLLSFEKTQNEHQQPAILFRWKSDAADRMEALTRNHLPESRGDRSLKYRMAILLKGTVVSAPLIWSVVRDAGIIEFGNKAREEEVNEIIGLLNGVIGQAKF